MPNDPTPLCEKLRIRITSALNDGIIGWVSLNRVKNSFIGKILTVFTIGSFTLANFSGPMNLLHVDTTITKLVFVGSIAFLIGYLMITIWMPLEFRAGPEMLSIVGDMKKIESFDFFKSRRTLLSNLYNRLSEHRPFDLNNDALKAIKGRIDKYNSVAETGYESSSASLYQADLLLRQFDRPVIRVLSATFLGIGLALISIPTAKNLVRIILQL